jgi:predicted alpha/beta hydrolase family esterase
MKKVIIIHGWEGHPEEGWFPWLKDELEALGYAVFIPQMPDTANPRIENWIPKLAEVAGTVDENTYFVGHSMGCQAIARFLETLPAEIKVGGAVFVAGFFKRLTGLEEDLDVQKTDKHWLQTPIDFAKVKSHLSHSLAIFSDNDPYVPLDNQDDFREKLGSEILIEHDKLHFSGSTGTKELPSVLKFFKKE